ncbi:MAG: crossover junction endodeoxyribonuclease RuvC [Phycisphaerales bacterium]|nr:MAG: crossover junction endodeoxyribonuclease RuvC [Phycisphaerales bacterium]
MNKPFRTCGIDPGLGVTGYAVLDAAEFGMVVVDAGVCRTDESLDLPTRLAQLERDVSSLLEEHKPDVLAVEKLYAHYKHPRTAIIMGHARGVILCAAGRRGIEVAELPATHVKKHLTGNGHASKERVQRAVQLTLGLSDIPEPPDVADALAIALCGAAGHCGERIA